MQRLAMARPRPRSASLLPATGHPVETKPELRFEEKEEELRQDSEVQGECDS